MCTCFHVYMPMYTCHIYTYTCIQFAQWKRGPYTHKYMYIACHAQVYVYSMYVLLTHVHMSCIHMYMYMSSMPTYINIFPYTYMHTCNIHTYLHESHKHTINHHIIYIQTSNTSRHQCTHTTTPHLSVCVCTYTNTGACMRGPAATSLTEDHEKEAQK